MSDEFPPKFKRHWKARIGIWVIVTLTRLRFTYPQFPLEYLPFERTALRWSCIQLPDERK